MGKPKAAELETLIHRMFGPAPRILILRGGRVGDFMSATPALRELRHAIPRARIGVIVSQIMAEFARRYRTIDDIFVAPGWPGVAAGPDDEATIDAFFQRMREWRADVAIQLNGGGENSNQFLLRLGARFTIGVRHPLAPDLDLTVPYIKTQMVRMRYLDVLRVLGITPRSLELDLPILPSDDEELRAALPAKVSLESLDRQPLLGIHAGSKSGARCWPPDRFAQVIDRLVADYGFHPVLLGTEVEIGEAISRRLARRTDLLNLCGKTSFGAVVALIRRLSLFLGNDSGPSHLAEAARIPSVVIYGSSHPLNWAPPQRAWHRVVADWTAPCRWFHPCGCPDDSSVPCLQAVTPDMVLKAAKDLLSCLHRRQCLERMPASLDLEEVFTS